MTRRNELGTGPSDSVEVMEDGTVKITHSFGPLTDGLLATTLEYTDLSLDDAALNSRYFTSDTDSDTVANAFDALPLNPV